MQYIEDCVLLIQGTGYLEVKAKHQSLLNAYNLNNKIIFIPPIPAEQIVSYASTADVGIFVCDSQDNKMYHALPNKLFEYVLAGIPQISCQGFEIERVFSQHHIGLLFDAYDHHSFYQKVTELLGIKVYASIKEAVLNYKEQISQYDDFIKI